MWKKIKVKITMAKKTIEMDLKITFTQSVGVEVDEEMLPLIDDYWC